MPGGANCRFVSMSLLGNIGRRIGQKENKIYVNGCWPVTTDKFDFLSLNWMVSLTFKHTLLPNSIGLP